MEQQENLNDLSKPFVKTYREGEMMVMETNLPNDTIGDFAFEWDLDGSQRKAWEEYIKDLEEKGIRGQLVHQKMTWKYDSIWDEPQQKNYKLSSYEMKIIDFSNGE